MKQKITRFITCLIFMIFGGGIVWGQSPDYIGTKGTISTYFGTSPSGTGPGNVNNEFGAGESSTVYTDGNQLRIKFPADMPVAVTAGNPPAIWLGSSISRNIVINTFAAKVIEGWYYEYSYGDIGFPDSDDACNGVGVLPFDFESPSRRRHPEPEGSDYGLLTVSGSYTCDNGCDVGAYPGSTHYVGGRHCCEDVEAVLEGNLSRYGFFSPYTSSPESPGAGYWHTSQDDDVPLVQFGGVRDTVKDEDSYADAHAPDENAPNFISYKRPTTVAIEKGPSVFTRLKIEDIRWWYTTFNVEKLPPLSVSKCVVQSYYVCDDNYNISHHVEYQAASVTHLYYDVKWKTETKEHPQFLDGAIQLLENSKVCVIEDIEDCTANPQSASSVGSTEAVLVLPKGNFELRVGNDFKPMDMYHDSINMEKNAYYSYVGFNDTVVPGAQGSGGNIYLYDNSVLGVKGTYSHGENARIHTENENAPSNDNGMIEVGTNTKSSSNTTNGAFYVYSGGYLKNFTDVCPALAECERINLSATNAPIFTINHDTEELYIVNDNENCCDSSINLDAYGIETIRIPLESTANKGPLSIHANSGSVNFTAPLSIDPVEEHDFKVYSDHSKITTKDFRYTMQNGTLTLHTYENLDDPDCNSPIIQTGNVEITQTGTAGNVKNVLHARKIENNTRPTFPYFDTATVVIPGYGTADNPLHPAQIITVQGDACMNIHGMEEVHTGDTLDIFQTVIRAADDSYRVTGGFELNTEDGGLLLQAGGSAGSGSVEIGGGLILKTTGNADIAIQSVWDSVVIGKSGTIVHVYEAEAGKEGDFLLSGHTGVYIHGANITTHPKGNQDVVIASEQGTVLFDAENHHEQGPTGHYLVYGNAGVDFAGDNGIYMSENTTTSDYAKLWSPAGWVRSRAAFTYEGGAHVPLTILAEGGTHGEGTPDSGAGGSVSFDGVTGITNPAGSDGITQIMSKNENVNIKNDFTFKNTAGGVQSGHILIQAGTDIYAADAATLSFNHYGDGQIIMEAHRDIDLHAALKVNQQSSNTGEFTMKAGYEGYGAPCGILFTDTSFIRQPGNLTNYENYAQSCSTGHGNIYFNGNAEINYGTASSDTLATVINAYRSLYINNKFDYITNSRIQAENHKINHHNYPGMSAGNLLLYAETGNVEAIENTGDTVNIKVAATGRNNGDIRIQAGPYLGKANCLFDEDHGNILFNKPLNIDNNGSGYTILQAHRDMETQTGAPATFTHAGITGNTDSAVMLVAGRHIETHAPVKFEYDHTARDGSITLWAGRMDHPDGLGAGDWACTDALCKTTEEGSNLALYRGGDYTAYDPSLDNTPESAMSAGGQGNGSILLFDTLQFNYYGDSTISLLAFNGNIESDPYLHKSGAGYDHRAPIIINHKGTGLTQLKAIDIKLHDKFEYNGTSAIQSKNGRLHIQAYDSILTRKVKYVNHLDTGSVYITTAKYKDNGCDEPYDCTTGGPGIHQGHIVLGYGADCTNRNENDSILFDYNSLGTNNATEGGNIHILAGFEGFEKNRVAGKGYGGNITFDYMAFYMPTGNGTTGGYAEIRTPNGNIWGKDSLLYRGINGNFLVDAGQGSADDPNAVRWNGVSCTGGTEKILNTLIPDNCGNTSLWRTGNIMMKGATLNFGNPDTQAAGTGDAIFRTREGFIDTYDAFTADSMAGHLLKYAGMESVTERRKNNWGDVSERDFRYTPVKESGSVFFGADDNIMLNYGNSNLSYPAYGNGAMGYPSSYDVTGAYNGANPYYRTSYEGYIDNICAATFDVNADGYMFYRSGEYHPRRGSHLLYRGCTGSDCSGTAGDCKTTSNGARDLVFNFDKDARGAKIQSGGLAVVASNYIDLFTKFTYMGGEGSALGTVPGMTNLHGEAVSGYGLYIKSQFNGEGNNSPEKRRATCEACDGALSWPIGNGSSKALPEMTYIGFHDDARIHTHRQKSLLEAPVIEFFGHAELDTETGKGSRTKITLKSDSLIFHDSVIFDGSALELQPFTTDANQRANDMRYGVINDGGRSRDYYSSYGPAIAMEDRGLPVLELGYQRCTEPGNAPNSAPNIRSKGGKERTPMVGGDVVVAFKHNYSLPIFNTVVANNARVSFVTDMVDGVKGGEYADAFIRTDLLRIRNKVEFYTDPQNPTGRQGTFVLATPAQMDGQLSSAGMYTRHLHTEPGSELSLPGEDSLMVISSTVVGGYGNIHENVFVKANGILAPGFASLMEGDCRTSYNQGTLTVHNLQMERDAVLRISLGRRILNVDGEFVNVTLSDIINVEDTVFTFGIISLEVLSEIEALEPGCYPFMTYGDSLGVSREYVKNFELKTTRFGDSFLALDYSESGKVNLCVTTFPTPVIQRAVDLPQVEGVTTKPEPRRHYVAGHKDFTFTAAFAGTPLKVTATGFYSQSTIDLDKTAKILADKEYEYTIRQVVEPWTIYIGPEPSSVVSNEATSGQRVWTYRNTLYINAEREDVISIYNLTGVLYKKVDISEGINRFTLEKGLYIVTLKDGSVHKIFIR